MEARTQDFGYFTLRVDETKQYKSAHTTYDLSVRDKFHKTRYGAERAVIETAGELLTRYLHKRPHKNFDSRVNIARSFVYLAPSFRTLYEYMPGGFVTYHAYDPEKKYIKNGKRLDPLARSFFRHSSDGRGVRSRAYAMAWRVASRYGDATSMNWMSIACGVGQATFDAARLLPADVSHYLIDLDNDALDAAKRLSVEYNIEPDLLQTEQIDVVKEGALLTKRLKSFQPVVVDAIGLFEYLPVDDAAALIKRVYAGLPSGGLMFFTGMLPTHPHLAVHRHGMGWPGVTTRTEEECLDICKKAGVPLSQVSVLRPSDGVYAVYEVVK